MISETEGKMKKLKFGNSENNSLSNGNRVCINRPP